jgi:nuclear pore complex protein Nup205
MESRVLPILADCDFVNTLPEADQSFIGMPCSLLHYWWLMWWLDHDYFLPSAIQHHHPIAFAGITTGYFGNVGPRAINCSQSCAIYGHHDT